MFGTSKTDKTQTAQLTEINKKLDNHWAWIVNLDGRLKTLKKNQAIMIGNNNRFIEIHKDMRQQLAQIRTIIASMQQVDAEFKARLAGLAKAFSPTAETSTDE